MKRTTVFVLSLCLTLMSLHAAESPSDLPHAVLSIGGQAGDGFAEGYGDILVPFYLTESGLWFVNPRFTAGDNGEEETNVGIGYRHLIPERNIIVGANVYYDARCTEHDNKFHQLGLGLELLTEWVDARANLYLPEDDEELVDRYTTQEVSVDSGSEWYDPYADGHAIEQDGKWWRTTTTTTYLYERFEQARQGWDAEIGVKLPIPPQYGEYRVFGGYYDWEAQYSDRDDVKGFKGRAEARVLPVLYLDAQVFEDDDLNGTEWTVGGRLILPFDLVALSNGDNPFAGVDENLKNGERSFSDRLFEMVIRDLQVRMETSDYEENVGARQVETSVEKGGLHETLLDDIMFVAQDRGADSNPGTHEEPKATISNGVINAFGDRNVFVYSSENEYDENVPVADNTQVYGEGSTIEGRGGKVYGGGAYPIVDGQSLGPAFALGNNTLLTGFRVINNDLGGPLQNDPVLAVAGYERVGVYAGNSTGVRIENLIAENCSIGGLLVADATLPNFRTTVSGSKFRNNDQIGLLIEGIAAGAGTFSTHISDSAFNDNLTGSGLTVIPTSYADSWIDVRRVTANNNGGDGLTLVPTTTMQDSHIVVMDVRANDNVFHGLNVVGTSSTGSINAVFRNVIARRNDTGGMFEINTLAGDASLGIFDSAFNGNGVGIGGLVADVTASNGNARTVLSGVDASGNLGIGLFSGNSALGTAGGDSLTILRNVHADNNGFYGMFVVGESASGNTTISIDPSSANNNGMHGADILGAANGGDLVIDIDDFDASDNTIYGIRMLGMTGPSGGNIEANLNNVRANDNGAHGIDARLNAQVGSVHFSALDSEANRNAGLNFALNLESQDGEVVAQIDGFEMDESATLFGMIFRLEANGAGNQALVDMQNVSADGNAIFGVEGNIQSFGGDASFIGNNVSANGNGRHGINLQTIAWGPAGDTSIDLRNTSADMNGTFGMNLLGYSVGGTADMALYDTHANGNLGLYGMEMALNGVNGPANVTLDNFEASGNAQYGANMYVLAGGVGNDINFDFTHVIADMNGTYGFTVNGIASGSAALTIDGGRADGNGAYGFSGNVTGNGGDATVDVDGFRASGNGQFGFSAGAIANGAGGTALVDLYHVRADGNGQFGIVAGAVAANGPASLVIGGDSRANDNTGYGLMGTVAAGNGAALVDLSDLLLNGNGQYGMHISATAAGAGNDVTINLADLGASGNVQYGMTLNGNAAAGAGYLNVIGGEANTNGTYGFSGNITGGDGVAMAAIDGFEADGNAQFGLAASATASGAGNAATVDIRNTSASANGVQGVIIGLIGNAGDTVLFGQNLEVRNNIGNGMELYTYPLGGGIYRLDLGGGSEGSLGLNSIVGNGGIGVANMAGGTVSVENNFWDGLVPVLGTDFNAGVTAPATWLANDPN